MVDNLEEKDLQKKFALYMERPANPQHSIKEAKKSEADQHSSRKTHNFLRANASQHTWH